MTFTEPEEDYSSAMAASEVSTNSSSSSDVESLFSAPTTTLTSPASTPQPEDGLSMTAREQLLHRLLAQMDPVAVREVEEAARKRRLKSHIHPPTVVCLEKCRVSTEYGQAFLYRYKTSVDDKEHLAWVYKGAPKSKSLSRANPGESEDHHKVRGNYTGTLLDDNDAANANTDERIVTDSKNSAPLVRIHSECFTGDIMGSTRCDCGEQLKEAKRQISQSGGVLVYLRQEGRGIGLGEKMKAYNLQDLGADTVVANQMLGHASDARLFGIGSAILRDLGLYEIRLLTNNPDKIESIEGSRQAVRVVERVAMIPLAWQNNPEGIYSKELDRYLNTKRTRMGHMLG